MTLPLDMPDEYPWMPGSGKSQSQDTGELAVRLGSPVSYDRRGTVYWFDDFEDGVDAWQLSVTAGTAYLRYVSAPVHQGLLAAKLYTSSGSQDSLEIKKRLAASILSTYGLETTFSVGNNVQFVQLGITFRFGSVRYEPAIKVYPYDGVIKVVDADSGDVVIDTVPILYNTEYLFHTMKFTCDLTVPRYGRLMYDRNEYDISVYTPNIGAIAGIEELVSYVSVGDNASGESATYLDNIIVTIGDQ